MKLQRAKTRVLLGKMRTATADDDVFELAEQFGIRRESVLVSGAEVMGCPVGTDEFIEGWSREKMTGTVRDIMQALTSFNTYLLFVKFCKIPVLRRILLVANGRLGSSCGKKKL